MSYQNPYDLIGQARLCFDRGDFRGAIARLEEAVASAHTLGIDNAELDALSNLSAAWGNIADHQKEVETATRLLARARALKREAYEMRATLRLAEALADLDLRNRWHELRPLLEDGLATARRLGDSYFEIYHLMKLGELAVEVGDSDAGYLWLTEALNTLRYDTQQQAWFRCQLNAALSKLMCQRGELTEAVRYAEIAIGTAREHGNPLFIAEARLILAQAERASGNHPEALRLVEQVLPETQRMGWRDLEQHAEYQQSEVLRELGSLNQAQVAARRALELAQTLKQKEAEVKSLLSLGQVLLAQKHKAEAGDIFTQARRLAQERDYSDHFSQAEKLLRSV